MEADAIMSSRRRARALSVTFAVLLSCPAAWNAQSVTVAWSPSRDSTVTGYRVYYGTASGAYSSWLDTGTNTTITIPDLQEGTTYYLGAVSYDEAGIESVLSNEASYTVPVSVAPPSLSAYPKRSFTDPLKLTFTANPDHWYELQATTDLSNWSTIWQRTNLTATAVLEFDDNDVGFVARFYRLVEH